MTPSNLTQPNPPTTEDKTSEAAATSISRKLPHDGLVVGESPITSVADDKLRRIEFASTIGRAAAGWDRERKLRHSLSIGLYGPWGSGKTSILNLIDEWIEYECIDPKPVVLRFNPWEWSSQDALYRAFFDELGRTVREKGGQKSLDLWNAYADQLQIYSSAVQSAFSIVTPAKVLAVAGLGLIGGSAVAESGRWVAALSGLLLLIPIIVKAVTETHQQQLTTRDKALTREGKSTLYDAKRRLADALAKLRSNLVVMIDDIDRLTPEQMATVFQLVKANGDFPSIVYILSFQKDTVETALQDARNVNGPEYLEKIIQVPFEVPLALPVLIRAQLDTQVRGLFSALDRNGAFNTGRWKAICDAATVFFPTLRKVNRYLDSLRFQCAIFTTQEGMEIDPVDLAALEILRTSVPIVHGTIAKSKGLFAIPRPDLQDTAPDQRLFEKLLCDLSPSEKFAVTEILKELFPSAATAYGSSADTGDQSFTSNREHRVFNPALFDRYFRLAFSDDGLSHSTIIDLARTISEPGILRQRLEECRSTDDLRALIERTFEVARWKLDSTDLNWVVPLLDLGDREFSDSGSGSPLNIARSLLKQWIRELGDKRGDLLKAALEQTSTLALPTVVTNYAIETWEWERDQQHRARLLELDSSRSPRPKIRAMNSFYRPLRNDLPASLKECANICADRIGNALFAGRLLQRPDALELLLGWHTLADETSVKDSIYSYLRDDGELIRLLRVIWSVRKEFSIARPASQLNSWFPEGEFALRLETLPMSELSTEDQEMVTAFKQVI